MATAASNQTTRNNFVFGFRMTTLLARISNLSSEIGAQPSTLTFTDDAANRPQTVALVVGGK